MSEQTHSTIKRTCGFSQAHDHKSFRCCLLSACNSCIVGSADNLRGGAASSSSCGTKAISSCILLKSACPDSFLFLSTVHLMIASLPTPPGVMTIVSSLRVFVDVHQRFDAKILSFLGYMHLASSAAMSCLSPLTPCDNSLPFLMSCTIVLNMSLLKSLTGDSLGGSTKSKKASRC